MLRFHLLINILLKSSKKCITKGQSRIFSFSIYYTKKFMLFMLFIRLRQEFFFEKNNTYYPVKQYQKKKKNSLIN